MQSRRHPTSLQEHSSTVNEAAPPAGQAQNANPRVSTPLRLWALDAEDLAIVSSHMQEALLTPTNAVWLPKQRRFALACERLDWIDSNDEQWLRRESGLHFDHVVRVERSGFGADSKALQLMEIRFVGTTIPEGLIDLVFKGGETIRLHVECVEACLRDLGEPEPTTIPPTSQRRLPQDRFSR